MLYPAAAVEASALGVARYQTNPVTVAVELFHYGFWSTASGQIHVQVWAPCPCSLSSADRGAGRLALGRIAFQTHRGQVRARL